MNFSVLLSVYSKEQPVFLRQCFESIFQQTSLPSEIVLVKDGPLTTELNQLIEEYAVKHPELKIVSLSENQGLGKALNEGLKHCSYDLVARMDTDDISKPDRFEKQLKVFQQHPEIDVCGAWIEEFYNDVSDIVSIRKVPESHAEIFKYAEKRSPVNHPVVMFRKRAVLNAGGYLHFWLFEDYYLWVRMLMNHCTFYNIPESLLYFRASPEMVKRRGGMKYLCSEIKFQQEMRRMKFISSFCLVKNLLIRIPVRVMPNFLRHWVYKYLLH
ncbi:glycosyltransferase [uncultured Bacteroides sp.]|uniref:glycosyltransferase family 2 protein n=1 Tax=uncultured Bacteroides sp. TaxID=162156 RepID=UPI0025DCE023|nr:glycosyltransferase [uncultured Bacteroides sp.]